MHLNELLSNEIYLDFTPDLHIREDRIRAFIHRWPEQIYEIIILLQKDNDTDHYIFQLPSGEGVLEFDVNNGTNTIDITFHNRDNLKFHRKFKMLLGEVFEDILSEKTKKKVHIKSVDDGDTYLATGT